MDRRDRALPNALRAAIALLFLQAVALAVLVAFVLAALGRDDTGRVLVKELLPFEVLAGVVVLALVALAWQLRRLRAWARGPVVALELLFIPVTYYLVGVSLIGVVITVSAMACVTLLVAPSSRTALGIRS